MRRMLSSIAGKLVFLGVLVVSSSIMIAVISATGFSRVEEILSDLVDHEIDGVIKNAELGRRISLTLSKVSQYSRECSDSSISGSKVGLSLSEFPDLSKAVPNIALRDTYVSFVESTETLIEECEQLRESQSVLKLQENKTEQNLLELEQVIGEELIEQTLQGKSINHLDQLMAMVAGIRESTLLVSRDIARYSRQNFENSQRSRDLVIRQIDDMSLRLQTMTASTDGMEQILTQLLVNLHDYRRQLTQYFDHSQKLNTSVDLIHGQQEVLLALLQHFDQQAKGRNEVIKGDLRSIISDYSLNVLVLTAFIALLTFFLLRRIVRGSIREPLDHLLGLIDEIKLRMEPKQLDHRNDEWGVISSHLVEMSHELKSSQSQLLKSQERLDIAIKGTNAGLWDWNLETNNIYFSKRWKAMLGYQVDELEDSIETWEKLVDPEQKKAVLREINRYLAGESGRLRMEYRLRHKDGHWVEVLSRGRLTENTEGQRRLIGTHIDITSRKVAELELRRSEKNQRTLIEALPDIILRLDVYGRNLFVSENITDIFFPKPTDYIGKNYRELGYPELFCSELENIIALVCSEKQSHELEFDLAGPEGTKSLNWKLTPDLNDQNDVRSVLAVVRDITELKRNQQQLERIAHYDVLTGLPNRALLADRMTHAMAQALRRQHQLALVYIDLDGFKEVNDNHGHVAGDHLLQTISYRLKKVLRDSDTLARLGGDELVAVITDLPDKKSCIDTLMRLLAAVAQPVQSDDLELNVSASMGVTFYPQDEELDADQLLRQADQAMYEAKRAGKNRYHFFDAAHDRVVRDDCETIERIKTALSSKEFELYYQPKVDMTSGEVKGVEALIRWNKGDQILPPAQFLPAVHDNQVGIDIDHWVIATAIEQASEWYKAGINLPVSINVSAAQLQESDFLDVLKQCLASCPDLPPENVELEILESGALIDTLRTSSLLKDCAAFGVTVALDDFGTGYSSLSYLKNLPVNTLKIDRSFIRGITENSDDKVILSAILGLARAFKLQVIAEGVESIEQGQLLIDAGCMYAQGYIIARPMPSSAIPQWIKSWSVPEVWEETSLYSKPVLRHASVY